MIQIGKCHLHNASKEVFLQNKKVLDFMHGAKSELSSRLTTFQVFSAGAQTTEPWITRRALCLDHGSLSFNTDTLA